MAHEILGLRDGGHAFKHCNWVADSVQDLLANHEKYVAQIPEEERYNIYFTVHKVIPNDPTARTWNGQDVMPIDIDDVDVSRAEDTAKFVCGIIGVDYNKTGVIVSGRGIQMFIPLETPIEDAKYFQENREFYKLIVMRVNQKLEQDKIKGKMDPAVFSASRLMRMPGTINRKPKKGEDVKAYVLQPHMERQGFDLITACGGKMPPQRDVVHKDAWKKFPLADEKGVQAECRFMVHAKKHQRDLSEQQWYAMIGTVGFLPNGNKLVHEYSKEHPGYSYEETAFKYEQATRMTGPRTCESIKQIWDGCRECPHNNKLKTPLAIQGPDYIATETTGFYKKWFPKDGGAEKIEPAYEDLIKYFKKSVGPFFSATSGAFYTYSREKKYWETFEYAQLKSFAYKHMRPEPRNVTCREFTDSILNAESRDHNWMIETTKRKLNLQNGVLDIQSGNIYPHSEKFGFMSILPYEYDENAKAPRFEQFLKEVTKDREDIANLLKEFMGYCISGDECFIHKALILIGEGRNGKSTFNKVLKALVGPGYYSSLSMKALQSDQKRYLLEGKLFNLGDENSPEGMLDSEIFKALIAGEEFDVKLVYKQPHTVRNRAKMIFNCNEMPITKDKSDALFQRLQFVPFDAKFVGENADVNIDAKLAAELPGILNICLEHYKILKKRERLPEVSASNEILEEYKDASDSFHAWFHTYVTPTSLEDKVTVDELFKSYKSHCEREGFYFVQRVGFGRKLSSITNGFLGLEYKRIMINGLRTNILFGAKLKHGF